MNILEAMTALNAGKKIRLRSWPNGVYLYLKYGQIFGENDKPDFDTISINNRTLLEEWEEYKEPILTNEEKEYLSAVIKPFRNHVKSIEKIKSIITVKLEYLNINMVADGITLPYFNKGAMYKRMEVDKEYTLEELGL